MKIALYTIFRCTNYGAVLQAYALARILRGLAGEDGVDVINHCMDPRDNHLLGKVSNPNTPWYQRWRNRRKFAARDLQPEQFEERRRRTMLLIEELVRPTAKLYRNPRELRGLPPYATVVVGSDQVWHPALNLDFGHNPYLGDDLPEGQDRVAYAASFGVAALPSAQETAYRTALRRFRRITVREESGATICERLLGARPEVVLDPTLLLTAADWRELTAVRTADASKTPPPHLTAYWVRTLTPADAEALGRIARARALPVHLFSAGPLPKMALPPGIEPQLAADPLDFVRAVSEATAVVTDSFHGLQFSAVFGRPFIALGMLDEPGGNVSRLQDFCRRYGADGGVHDLTDFRTGAEAIPFAKPEDFDAAALAADRRRSQEALTRLLP